MAEWKDFRSCLVALPYRPFHTAQSIRSSGNRLTDESRRLSRCVLRVHFGKLPAYRNDPSEERQRWRRRYERDYFHGAETQRGFLHQRLTPDILLGWDTR